MRLLARQIAFEQLVFWRSREAAIFVFLLPVLLFVLLGAVYTGDVDGYDASTYLLVGMLGYGVANTAFGGLAIFLVLRRESGLLKRIRSTPLPAPVYLLAVGTSILAVFALQSTVLLVVGRLALGAEDPALPGSLVLVLALSGLAFAALGLAAAAAIRSAEGASPIVNVVILPMAFLSGSFGPADEYPAILRAIGDVLPLKHAVDLVIGAYLDGEAPWERPVAVGMLAAWAAFGALLAWRRFGWEPRAR